MSSESSLPTPLNAIVSFFNRPKPVRKGAPSADRVVTTDSKSSLVLSMKSFNRRTSSTLTTLLDPKGPESGTTPTVTPMSQRNQRKNSATHTTTHPEPASMARGTWTVQYVNRMGCVASNAPALRRDPSSSQSTLYVAHLNDATPWVLAHRPLSAVPKEEDGDAAVTPCNARDVSLQELQFYDTMAKQASCDPDDVVISGTGAVHRGSCYRSVFEAASHGCLSGWSGLVDPLLLYRLVSNVATKEIALKALLCESMRFSWNVHQSNRYFERLAAPQNEEGSQYPEQDMVWFDFCCPWQSLQADMRHFMEGCVSLAAVTHASSVIHSMELFQKLSSAQQRAAASCARWMDYHQLLTRYHEVVQDIHQQDVRDDEYTMRLCDVETRAASAVASQSDVSYRDSVNTVAHVVNGTDEDEDSRASFSSVPAKRCEEASSTTSFALSSFSSSTQIQTSQLHVASLYAEMQKRYQLATAPMEPMKDCDRDHIPLLWAEAQRADVRLNVVSTRRKRKVQRVRDWKSHPEPTKPNDVVF